MLGTYPSPYLGTSAFKGNAFVQSEANALFKGMNKVKVLGTVAHESGKSCRWRSSQVLDSSVGLIIVLWAAAWLTEWGGGFCGSEHQSGGPRWDVWSGGGPQPQSTWKKNRHMWSTCDLCLLVCLVCLRRGRRPARGRQVKTLWRQTQLLKQIWLCWLLVLQ